MKMPAIKTFVFNPFQVNTYVLSDESGECIIIDPACGNAGERAQLEDYIREEALRPAAILNTHAHVDHLPGVSYFRKVYRIPFMMHAGDLVLLEHAVIQGGVYGFDIEKPDLPDRLLEEGDIINFGHSGLRVIHVPGHSPGSVVFSGGEDKYLMTGDVLFYGSIGRTDLPGGDYPLLMRGIKEKILVLDDETLVCPGHGPSTTIGFEREHNPFLH